MKIVLTHVSPDFDALSSAYAALKLHGCDTILTSTSYETNVSNYVDELGDFIPLKRISEAEIESIKAIELLVVTDCKLLKRLGKLEPLAGLAKEVIVYDHHLITDSDIDAKEKYIEEKGSTTTIILPKIFEKNIQLTEEESGLFLLGIYEDTGMMSFSSTTPEDLKVAARLLEFGADLGLVGEYIKREMSREQVFVLNELLINMSLIRMYGITIAVSNASIEKYVGEISFLTHRIMDIENLDALFVVVRTGERIVMIGRSNIDEVSAVGVINQFGGGGHPSAASANIKQMTLHETIEKMKQVIKEQVRPVKLAEEVMNFPIMSVQASDTFQKAMERFMKYNLNMMPVIDRKRPVGLISRRDILSGIKHGFSEEPVKNIMQIEFDVITPDTPYYKIEDIMVNRNRKMLLVMDGENLEGVITRTDLIRIMYEEVSKMPRYTKEGFGRASNSGRKNIGGMLKANLNSRVNKLLKDVSELADEMKLKCFLVGGVVRDILMKIPNDDIDIVVVGDAPVFAKEFAKRHKARISVHIKFRTAVVIFDDGFRVDFATSRTEYYDNPAAAPIVEGASIRNDLYRRDFSINSMAVQITGGGEYGLLLDYYGGQRDILDKKIRVLHSLSFVDDPSRAFRAIRFAVRFGFEIGPQTDKLLKHAVSLGLFDRIIGARLFLELKYILTLEDLLPAIEMMKKYDLLKFFNKNINVDSAMEERFDILDRLYGWYNFQFEEHPEIYKSRFVILFYTLNPVEMGRLSKKLDLNKKQREDLLRGFFNARNAVGELKVIKDIKPSILCGMFCDFDIEYVLAAIALAGDDYINFSKDYLTEYRYVELEIDGNALIKAGKKPSGKFSEVLKKVKNAKLDGIVDGFDEELDFALKLFEEVD